MLKTTINLKIVLVIFSSLFFQTAFVSAQEVKIHKEINELLSTIKEFRNQEWKRDSSNNQPLRSHTEESYSRAYNFYKQANNKLGSINQNDLPFQDQINFELLQHDIRDNLAQYEFKSYLNPILSYEGFHTYLANQGNTTISNSKEADRYIKLLRDVPRYVNEYFGLMRRGLSLGISQPKVLMQGLESTYAPHIVDTVENSVFWKPFLKRPISINETEWQEYRTTALQIIHDDVITSYRKIKDFFETEYLPKTRSSLGASEFPDGAAYYENRVRHYTTTNLTSEEVYQIGLKEVDRIQSEMDKVIKQVNFKGGFKEFVAYLRTEPRFYPKTSAELLKEASYIAKKIDGKLPALFGKLPRQPYTVVPMEQAAAPPGLYSGSRSAKNPGSYLVNILNLSSRSLYTLEALTLHESVPGHHLQISLASELDHLPEFRKTLYINAFGEGWGLYSEFLGHEMDLYKDPYSLFGRLTYDMWRACRLVIDVGIHSKGWTREQAINYLADHTALSLHEVNTEVNRYISWPGQALAYKMGEIKIREMRRKAETALKGNFDVRSFHDMILSHGSVTLSLLERITDRYIQEQLKRTKSSEIP